MFYLYSQIFHVPAALILSLSFHTYFTFPAQNSITHFLCIVCFTIFLSFCVPLWSLISCTWSSGFIHFSFHDHNPLVFFRTSYPSFWLVFWATYIRHLCVVSLPPHLLKLRLSSHLFLIEPLIACPHRRRCVVIIIFVIIIFMFPLQFKILYYHSSL
jgi:hypothetical protein